MAAYAGNAAEAAFVAEAKEKEAAEMEDGEAYWHGKVEGFGMAGLSQVGRWNQPAEEAK
ncbi:MAG: hypothetical protein LBU23_03650 [Planctomycetota bacterium]|nr:hypothetical protein [Planctomycetota bacterium]